MLLLNKFGIFMLFFRINWSFIGILGVWRVAVTTNDSLHYINDY